MVEEKRDQPCCFKYAMVFMDINMPIMNGIDATKKLKQGMREGKLAYTPIIAVSAAHCNNEQELAEYLTVGFDEFGKKRVLKE